MRHIIDLQSDDEAAIAQTAALLTEAFNTPGGYPTMAAALAEVRASFEGERISRVALGADGTVLGWIGGVPQYNGHVWELHPLVVRADQRGQGIGQALVADLEAHVQARGGLTLWLGTDDEHNQTTLANRDLYPNVWEHIAKIQNPGRHPYEFYQKLGFVIVGVMPDANGYGKPDIFMAKRIGDSSTQQ